MLLKLSLKVRVPENLAVALIKRILIVPYSVKMS